METFYIIASFWTLNYTRSAANARPLFALLVVVYPTYFCRILCLLGVLTGRYRTPVYFQRMSIISINENTSMRASITCSRTTRPTRSRELRPGWKWENSRKRLNRKFSQEHSRVRTLEIDSSSKRHLTLLRAFDIYARVFSDIL